MEPMIIRLLWGLVFVGNALSLGIGVGNLLTWWWVYSGSHWAFVAAHWPTYGLALASGAILAWCVQHGGEW